MIARYRLSCGHVIRVTIDSLTPDKRRPRTPVEWWCRRCEADLPVKARLG